MRIMTIGHSSFDWRPFQFMLDRHEIGLVVDVRSYPKSRLRHFSKPELRARLNYVGISYIHAGGELGGYTSAGTDYAAMASSTNFLRGIDRVLDLAGRTRVALLCAEHEPLECHRCLLIGRHLAGLGGQVEHILRSGLAETHSASEDRLLAALGRTEVDLLASREVRLEQAYEKQAHRINRGLRLPRLKPAQLKRDRDA